MQVVHSVKGMVRVLGVKKHHEMETHKRKIFEAIPGNSGKLSSSVSHNKFLSGGKLDKALFSRFFTIAQQTMQS